MKYECCLASVCLPDYWGGHHKPHICVPVTNETTPAELVKALHFEVNDGAIAGSDAADLTDKLDAMCTAIDAIGFRPGAEVVFPDIPDQAEDDDSAYAYFVFVEVEA